MPGKDKTVKAGKSKKALDKEWEIALQAADNGERLIASTSNTGGGGAAGGRHISPNYIAPKKPPKSNTADSDDDEEDEKGKKGKTKAKKDKK